MRSLRDIIIIRNHLIIRIIHQGDSGLRHSTKRRIGQIEGYRRLCACLLFIRIDPAGQRFTSCGNAHRLYIMIVFHCNDPFVSFNLTLHDLRFFAVDGHREGDAARSVLGGCSPCRSRQISADGIGILSVCQRFVPFVLLLPAGNSHLPVKPFCTVIGLLNIA